MPQEIFTHQFNNGLVLLAEPMDWLESAAFTMLLPAGCSRDPEQFAGLSNVTSEMLQRGAGSRDSRQFVEAIENLGVDGTSGVSNSHTTFAAAMPATNLYEALSIYADLIRRPWFPEDQMSEGLQVCLQEVWALEDDPAQQAIVQLKKQHYRDPWGRSCQGTEESLAKITIDDVRQQFEKTYHPNETIIGIAGKFDWATLLDQVAELFEDWKPFQNGEIQAGVPQEKYWHKKCDSTQTHLGVAYDSVPYRHPDYYQARGAVGVLSDGMSSRLFTEVRERRGLCYTVYASMHSLQDRGSVLCYAGTSTDRAQETLDVMMAELLRLSQGIQQNELDRLKARVKSSLIMQQESSRSRSGSVAVDWYYLGRVQTMEEISQKIDSLTCESINSFLNRHQAGNFTIVTLGENALEVPVGIS